MKKEYEIEIAYKCNWACEYCCVQTHTKKPISDLEILENLFKHNIKDSNLTISGGDPSYASDYLILNIVAYCQANNIELNINTNGRFFEKKQHLLQYFNEINYHCSEDLEPIKIQDYKHLHNNITYLLIVTDNNLHNLERFLNINNNIQFLIIPASNPYGVKNVELSLENYKRVFPKFSKNMNEESKLRFLTKNKIFNDMDITYITNFKKD